MKNGFDSSNKLGRFTALKSTADIAKAKAYFDQRDNCDNRIPKDKVLEIILSNH